MIGGFEPASSADKKCFFGYTRYADICTRSVQQAGGLHNDSAGSCRGTGYRL